MPLLQIEQFTANPDWLRISAQEFSRAYELVALIQSQSHLSHSQQKGDYRGWILELKGILET